MLTTDQIRSTPNKGRYLFHNRILHLLIGGVDSVLESFKKPSQIALSANPKRILLCCQAHIGDAILATSVLPVLKAAFPDAQFGFLIHPGSIDVFTDNPKIAWLHTIIHWNLNRQNLPFWKKLLSYLKSRSKLLQEIKAIDYDLAIDLYPYFPNSIPLLFSAKIPLRLGWMSGGFGGLLTHGLEWEDSLGHVVDWHKHVLSKLIPCQKFLTVAKPEIYSSEAISHQWTEISMKLAIKENFIAFHIGAGGAYKYWPTQYWQQLASLCLNVGKSIVLLGHGVEEERICHEIAGDNNSAIHNLSGKLSWGLMTEAIGRSKLLIGLDSSSGHIAAAKEIPSVSIYTGITQTRTWRPYHPLSRVLLHTVPCSPCYLKTGCEGMECVRLVTPSVVFKEIMSLAKI
jgi:ADP-heptose:LPS heptosyltransferase